MELDDCYKKGYIRKIKVNLELVKSLVEMSDIKEQAVKNAKIDEINISAYVSMAYDSLRETLEALCISLGYKVTSHICLGELLRELIDDFDYEEFDRLRYIRNGVNYYGVKVDFPQGKEIIKKIFSMKRKIAEKHLRL